MRCDLCGKPGAKIRQVNRAYGKGEDLLIVEKVPVVSCRLCGGIYTCADTLRKVDHLRRHSDTLGVLRSVRSVDYISINRNASTSG